MKQVIMAVVVGTSATVLAWHRLPKAPPARPVVPAPQTVKIEPARPVKRRHVASRPKKTSHAKTELATRKSWESSR